MPRSLPRRDVVIVGGGHNGLVAAGYLAKAGLSVTVLEKQPAVGGAAISAQAFDGVDASLSRYSYLVSLLPRRVLEDLGISLELIRRRYSSYTPDPTTSGSNGLLIDTVDPQSTASSFAAIGAGEDWPAWVSFYRATTRAAEAIFPTMTEPLPTRDELRRRIDDDLLWSDLVENPIGSWIERSFSADLVRGVAMTDALIGNFAGAHQPAANPCFLYHVIGNGTGDWDVPVGGMGAVSGALARCAHQAGAQLITEATVTAVDPDGQVRFEGRDGERTIGADRILSGVSPQMLARLIGEDEAPAAEGAQVKVNLLLSRLPRLRDQSVAPEQAFAGTFHINEGYSQLEQARQDALSGLIPRVLPAEIYCHTLSDRSILGPELRRSGAHTLTVFGLHTPHRLAATMNEDAYRDALQQAVVASFESVLAEPIEGLLLRDAKDEPCIETKTTADLERSLGLPGGNIFHGSLDWPFAEQGDTLGTAAGRWGVQTAHPRVLLCGSGARRGGAVSGIGGQNAAMAVLETY